MNSLIRKRAQERAIESEKAQRVREIAETLVVCNGSGQTIDAHLYAPLTSNTPSRCKKLKHLGDNVICDLAEFWKNLKLIFFLKLF